MNSKSILYFLLAAAVSSCAPKVTTDMYRKEVKPLQTDSVKDPTVLRISAGPVWTVSTINTEYTDQTFTNVRGTGFDFSLIYYIGKYYGFGLDFTGSHTKVPKTGSEDFSYSLFHLGPNFSLDTSIFHERLHGHLTFGIGGAYYSRLGQSEFGFSLRGSIGLDYRFSQNLGIGIELLGQDSHVSTPDWYKNVNQNIAPSYYKINKSDTFTFDHLGVMVGIRFYP